MFVGHYGVSFAMRGTERRVPLWVWFLAVQWMDILWTILVMLGVEKLRIVPGFTQANALDLYYMPYTHSLPGALLCALIFGAIVAVSISGSRASTFLLVAAASFSHWILDLIVHVPDLPLYGNSAKVGLGLWRHVILSFPLELLFLIIGAAIYGRSISIANAKGRWALWIFVACLVLMQVYANFGPPPPSPSAKILMMLVVYLAFALAAGWVERVVRRGEVPA